MMRPITRATIIVFVYVAITSHWVEACNEILQMMNLISVAPESIPNISQNVWGYIFTVFERNTNKPILLFSLVLLCASLITKVLQIKDDMDLA